MKMCESPSSSKVSHRESTKSTWFRVLQIGFLRMLRGTTCFWMSRYFPSRSLSASSFLAATKIPSSNTMMAEASNKWSTWIRSRSRGRMTNSWKRRDLKSKSKLAPMWRATSQSTNNLQTYRCSLRTRNRMSHQQGTRAILKWPILVIIASHRSTSWATSSMMITNR